MDIGDAQVHANMLGTDVTVAIMDALGIRAVLSTLVFTPADGAVFEGGGHNPLFKAARAHSLPVFVT